MLLASVEAVLHFRCEDFCLDRFALYLIDGVYNNFDSGCINGCIKKALGYFEVRRLWHMTAIQTRCRCKFGGKLDSSFSLSEWNPEGIAEVLCDIAECRFAGGHAKDFDPFNIRIVSIRSEPRHDGLKCSNLAA